MDEKEQKPVNVNEEILHYKRLIKRDNIIIIVLSVVLLIVIGITIYVRL